MEEPKNILITGGCGFIGSNFVLHLAKKYPNYKLINLDLMTYASDSHNEWGDTLIKK